MRRIARFMFRLGCLVAVLAPLAAIILYPKAKWLFAFVLVGIALLAITVLTAKAPTPQEVAEHAERLLNGTAGEWGVDDYEHLNPKNPNTRELWHRTMVVGGSPEEWVRLDEAKKNELREIIRAPKRAGGA